MKLLAAATLALLGLVPSDAHAGFGEAERFAVKELNARLPKIQKEVTTEYGKSIMADDSAIEVEMRRINRSQIELGFPVAMHAHPDRVEDAGAAIVTFQFVRLNDAKFQWKLKATAVKSLEDFVRRHAAGYAAIDYIKRNPAIPEQIALSWTVVTCKVFDDEASTLIKMFFTEFKPSTRVWVDTWVNPEQLNPLKSGEGKRGSG